jgi:hypothetical protein
MNFCLHCNTNTTNPKFCSRSCAACFNNTAYPKRTLEKTCKNCLKKINASRTYCDDCKRNFQKVKRSNYIELWLKGEVSGGNSFHVSQYVKNHLKDSCEHKCPKCGWSEVNPYTGKVPLEINHINNDPFDHSPTNLEVLCPNCHSLKTLAATSTKGKGRYSKDISHPQYGNIKPEAPGLS